MKQLYAVRPGLLNIGIVTYEQIENDLYKDTTCSNHKNCIVRIAQNEKNEYKIVECINDEAKRHSCFHRYETPLFETRKEAIVSYADSKIEEYNRDIEKEKVKILEYETKIKVLEQSELIVNTPKLKDFDFGDMVYLARIDKPDSDILTFKVDKKVFVKDDSFIEIQSDDYGRYCDEYGETYVEGYCVNKTLIFTDGNENKYQAFKDFTSAENSLKKLKIELLKKEVEHCEKSIKNYEGYIEKCNKAKKDAKNETI